MEDSSRVSPCHSHTPVHHVTCLGLAVRVVTSQPFSVPVRPWEGEMNGRSQAALGGLFAVLLFALAWANGADVQLLTTQLTTAVNRLITKVGIGEYAFFALVVVGAFAVRGATGFGSAAIATPLATLVLPVQFVIPVVASLQLWSTTEYSVRNWRHVDWREMLRIAPFLVAGAVLGLYLFYTLDARAIAQGLGVIVIVYAIYAMATAGREQGVEGRLSWPIAVGLNTAGSFVGALFGGASSPFYVIYFKALRLSRDAFRATMSMVVLVQVVLRIGGYAGMGFSMKRSCWRH